MPAPAAALQSWAVTARLCLCAQLTCLAAAHLAGCACSVPVESPQRFRIELLFSPGANFSPYEVVPLNKDHTLPVQPRACLHKGKQQANQGSHVGNVAFACECCELCLQVLLLTKLHSMLYIRATRPQIRLSS